MPTVDAAPPILRLQRVIDHQSWQRYDAQLDPLASHQPPLVNCPASSAFVEFDAFEVDTTRCNYVLAQNPSLLSVPAGTTMKLSLLHYDLLAPEPAEAHLAIFFGDALQWEMRIPIPSDGKAIDVEFVTTRALAAGEPIRYHLHNHGGNTYLLFALEALLP
jgi:hypothetical protein